jgi:hypothetical protein
VSSADDVAVAVEIVAPPDSIHVGDTVVIHVRALNRGGDSIAAAITLVSLTPDTLGVDNTKLAIIGKAPGTGRAIAVTGSLPSEPFAVPVK